jgi:electron transport complex protein RnfE
VTTDVATTAEAAEPIIPGAPPPQPLTLDFWRGIADDNPVMIQLLGLCPAMAVSNSLENGIGMSAAVIFVLFSSSLLVSALRKIIPGEVRLASYILIIATFVTISDLVLQAYFPLLSKTLGPFVPLIVVNCMILGRAEAFAGKVKPVRAAVDALGMGAGFTLAICTISAIREILGNGTLLGFHLFGPNYEPWVFMIMPPGGFLTMGIMLLVMGWWGERKKAKLAEVTA